MPRISAAVLACLTMASSDAMNHFPRDMTSRHLSNVGFEQTGSTLFGAPRFDPFLTNNFGAAVSLTPDGMHLVVGATNHDADNTSEGNGAIFIYDFVNPDWTFSTSVIGNTGEGLGDRFSISDDATRLAVRRRAGASDFVEVYEAGSLLGSPLSTCTAIGNAVSISPSGNRVAVSCERADSSAGLVEVYEWNEGDANWNPLGTPLLGRVLESPFGTATNTLFGFATSFDASGNRLAISAPLRDSESATRVGAFRVFEYVAAAGSWNQIGQQIFGTSSLGQFGVSLDLSASGTTLVIGAPGAGAGGEVHAYEFNAATSQWITKGAIVFGEVSDDNFGRSVSISADGSRLAASSSQHNEGRGHVRLFDFDGTNWVQVGGDIEGLAPDDEFGYGIKSVSLSGDGTRVASGSTGADDNNIQTGSSRVFDQDPVPSMQPSAAPSFGPFPALVPTATSAVPTVVLDKFSWDLNRTGNVAAVFSQATEEQEIMLEYNISLRSAVVKVFTIDCITPVSSTYVNVSHYTDIVSSTHGKLDVSLDIKQDTIVGSPIWRDGVTTREGLIDLCVRVDLVLDDGPSTSVNFHEQQLYLTIGLSQGFTVTGIDLDREDPDELNQDVQVDYGLEACQCNSTFHCNNETLVQGDDVYICISSTDDNIEISAIEELDLIQGSGGLEIAAIDNSIEDALTAVLQVGKVAVVRSQMRSDFFLVSNPADVVASGLASVIFMNDTTAVRRELHVGNARARGMQETTPDDAFEVTMSLASAVPVSGYAGGKSDATMGRMYGGLAGGLIASMVVVAVVFRRGKKEDGEDVEIQADDYSTGMTMA